MFKSAVKTTCEVCPSGDTAFVYCELDGLKSRGQLHSGGMVICFFFTDMILNAWAAVAGQAS